MKKNKKATVGERIASRMDLTWGYASDAEARIQRKFSRSIDAAIRRVVREAYHAGFRSCANFVNDKSARGCELERQIEAKYKVKL